MHYKSICNALIMPYNALYDLMNDCNSYNALSYTFKKCNALKHFINSFRCNANIIMDFLTLVTIIYEMI